MAKLRSILLVLVSSACAADGDDGTTAADTGSQSTTETPSTSESGSDDTEAEDSSEADASSSTIDPTTATTGLADTGSSSESTGEAPTSGPGVLPGEGGLEAFCRRYVECGGTYYADEQACIDASYDYWGDCATRAAALDEFGACMSEIECTDWSPDAYNPASTPCAEQWQGVGDSRPC
jgi:hypothetical protein